MHMDAIRFNTIVGDYQVIRLPAGIALLAGPCEVTVKPAHVNSNSPESLPLGSWEWLLAMAAEAERDSADLPADMAENHDFYAHGKPRE
jgi:hypothetical protein